MGDLISISSNTQPDDFRGIFNAAPSSFAARYPEIPNPDPPLSPQLLMIRWVTHDLYGEDMPQVAIEMLEAGYDSPSLRRLAGETNVHCSADVADLVESTFRELGITFPISEKEAKLLQTRQVAREVIAGLRNPWAAASHLEIVVWGRQYENQDVAALAELLDELDWDAIHRRRLSQLTADLVNTFARLAT